MLYRYLTRVNSYSQPDHKKTFFTTPLSQRGAFLDEFFFSQKVALVGPLIFHFNFSTEDREEQLTKKHPTYGYFHYVSDM